jgi:hypothetical protein
VGNGTGGGGGSGVALLIYTVIEPFFLKI